MKKTFNLYEFCASALYEEADRSLFYRKALCLRRFYENCDLPAYNGETLYPSGKVFLPSYMSGLPINLRQLKSENRELGEQIEKDFFRYSSSVPEEHGVAGNMFTHSMPNYERIIKEGFSSYIPRIEKISDTDLKEGLLHLLAGINAYVNRCTKYLKDAGAGEKLISALKKVPMNPAENLYEAVVAWNLILYLDSCDNLGCPAKALYSYYNGEDITELLRNLFDNLDANDGYSMALHTEYNELTLQCLEASKGKRRPMIELFVDENTPDEIWNKAFEVIRTSNGQPAFYNPSVLLGGLQKNLKVSAMKILKISAAAVVPKQ